MRTGQRDSVNTLLGQVIRCYHMKMAMSCKDLGIYPGQPPLLYHLSQNDGCTQRELSEALFVKPATITVMLKRMEKSGLLERRIDPTDLRVSRTFLTIKGQSTLEKIQSILSTIDQECFTGFTPEELLLLRRFLMHMRKNLCHE